MGHALGRFTPQFKDEYYVFRKTLVESGTSESSSTPFWAAVEAISWAKETTEAAESSLAARLTMELPNPNEPIFELLTTSQSCRVGPDWTASELPSPIDAMIAYILRVGDPARRSVIEAVLGLDSQILDVVRAARIDGAISQGCICFARGEGVGWEA